MTDAEWAAESISDLRESVARLEERVKELEDDLEVFDNQDAVDCDACERIPAMPILLFVWEHGGVGCTWFVCESHPESNERSVSRAFPKNTPEKYVRMKMRALIQAGLVRGCSCGCRGDFELTDLGKHVVKGRKS